jgi:type I restriction enzyme S subunit
MRKLGDVFKISKGKKAIETSNDTGLRYIQIGDLRNDDVMKYTFSSTSNVLCNKDDVLIAWDGANAGTVGYNLEGVIGSTLAKLTPKIKEINSEYVGRFLQSKFSYLRENCTGATIPHLSRPILEGIQIPFPPLPQQQKIANILDAADALRHNDKALIAKYDELTQALFLDIFGDPVSNPKGWEKVSGKIVFKLVGGAAFKSSDYTLAGLPLIRIGTVNKGYFDNSQLAFLPKSFEETHSRYIVYPNDLLITLTGTVGKDDYGNAFTLSYEYEKYLLNQRVAKICSSDNYNLVFLKFFLKQKKVKNELIGVSRGVRQANLSNEDFYKLEVINPSIDIQNQFAERIALIEEQRVLAQKSLEKSEELFNSLLQKAFKGELL